MMPSSSRSLRTLMPRVIRTQSDWPGRYSSRAVKRFGTIRLAAPPNDQRRFGLAAPEDDRQPTEAKDQCPSFRARRLQSQDMRKGQEIDDCNEQRRTAGSNRLGPRQRRIPPGTSAREHKHAEVAARLRIGRQ
jgi:hypothetical protein